MVAERYGTSLHISPVRAANEWGNELNSRGEIPCLRTPMYYYIFVWNLQFFGRKYLNNNGLLHEKLFETELIALRRFSKFNLRWKCYHNFLILDIRTHSTNISFCLSRFLTLPSRLLLPSFFFFASVQLTRGYFIQTDHTACYAGYVEVRALAFHQYGLGSTPTVGWVVCWLSVLFWRFSVKTSKLNSRSHYYSHY